LPSDINVQSAQFTVPLVNDITNPTGVDGDLLRPVTSADEVPGLPTGGVSIASLASPGTTLIELNDNDGKTWSLLQVLQTFGQTKILSHPHVISTNNKNAFISIGEERLVVDAADVGNTAANVRNIPLRAVLEIDLLPRISGGPGGIVNLCIKIKIEEFTGPATATSANQRITRGMGTSANVKDGNILALGGLITTEEDVGLRETPILAKIPILGWFFKNRTGSNIKTNLTVFIKPTIIMPRLRRGVNQYTKDYIEVAKKYSTEGELFDGLQEPITRFFFQAGPEVEGIVNEFLQKDEYQKNMSETDADLTPRERRKARKKQELAARTKERDKKELKSIIQYDENPLITKDHTKRKDLAQL
jgi:Flp pilus assembly secretin CpaC